MKAWRDNTHLEANLESFNLTVGTITAGQIVARINAARALGRRLLLNLTGGSHNNYLTDYGDGQGLRFDRLKWSSRLHTFNTVAIKAAMAEAVEDVTVQGVDVMDEPNVTGQGDGDGNTWGPPGTMRKTGASAYDVYRVSVSGASAGADTVGCSPLYSPEGPLPTGTTFAFLPGAGKTARLRAPANPSVTTLLVDPLPVTLNLGDAAHSNSIDNMVAEVKGIFGPLLPVGVTHKWETFWPDQSYAVADFIVAGYAYRNGDINDFKDSTVAGGVRDGHRIVFAINSMSGGIQAVRDGNWNCPLTGPKATGGRGSFNPNCKVTATQLHDWGILLGAAGAGLTLWRFDEDFMANEANQEAEADIATAQAALSAISWLRP